MIRIPHVPLAVLSALTILVTAGLAPAQKRAKAESKATSKHTTTHRVVIVNGKTIVDEKAVNGKRVPSNGVEAPPPDMDAEEMIRELRERMRRARGKDLPDAGDVKKSTHTRRVVVKNGKVVEDEETRDGKPVKRGDRKNNEKKSPERPAAKRKKIVRLPR